MLKRGRRTNNAALSCLEFGEMKKTFFCLGRTGLLTRGRKGCLEFGVRKKLCCFCLGDMGLFSIAHNAALASAAGLNTLQEKTRKGKRARSHVFVSTRRPSWHFPVCHVPDAEDAGNARDASTQLTGTDSVFALKKLRLSDTEYGPKTENTRDVGNAGNAAG